MPLVEESCLALQDDIGLDVNVLLLGLLASKLKNRALSSGEISSADILVKDWREEIVSKLRELRRRLKSGPMPAPSIKSDQLRNDIKRAELAAERLQQEMLAMHLDGLPELDAQSRLPSPDDRQSVQVENLDEAWGLFLSAQRIVEFYCQFGHGPKRLSEQLLNRHAEQVAMAAVELLPNLINH